MSTHNLFYFYYNKYQRAWQRYCDEDVDGAEEQCRELINEYLCPRLLQAQAWQLRSLCTKDYWLSKSHLNDCLTHLESLEAGNDHLVNQYITHTQLMLRQLEQKWEKQWADQGLAPPSAPNPEDYVGIDDGDIEDVYMRDDSFEDAVEQQRTELEGLALLPEFDDTASVTDLAAEPSAVGSSSPLPEESVRTQTTPPTTPAHPPSSPPLPPSGNHHNHQT